MIELKTLLENYYSSNNRLDDEGALANLVYAGLIEEKRLPILKRALYNAPENMTVAEKKALTETLESLIFTIDSELIAEAKQNHLSKFDKRMPPGYPKEGDAPAVIVLQRKAIRVFPDNQKIALYYSQALDKYVSIPLGPQNSTLGIHMSEETNNLEKGDNGIKKKYNIIAKLPPENLGIKLKNPHSVMMDKTVEKYKKVTDDTSKKMMKAKEEPIMTHTFKKHLQKLREEAAQQVTEIAPVIPAVVKAASAAKAVYDTVKGAKKVGSTISKVGRRVKGKHSIASKLKNFMKSKDDNGGAKENDLKPITGATPHETSAPGRYTANISGTQRISLDAASVQQQADANRRIYGRSGSTSMPAMAGAMNEDVFDTISKLATKRNAKKQIQISENSISINSRMAKRIISVYDSLNETNKEKMKKMINESVVSFKKVLDFAIRQ